MLQRLRSVTGCVTGCVTDRPLLATGSRPSPQANFLSFAPRTRPVPLTTRGGDRDIAVRVRLDYVVDRLDGTPRAFEVRKVAYWYEVLARDGHEVLAYHWHPAGVSPITFPHHHLSSRLGPLALGRGARTVALGEMHLPTGFITLADVVRLLIAELGIAPRRPDWEAILRDEPMGSGDIDPG